MINITGFIFLHYKRGKPFKPEFRYVRLKASGFWKIRDGHAGDDSCKHVQRRAKVFLDHFPSSKIAHKLIHFSGINTYLASATRHKYSDLLAMWSTDPCLPSHLRPRRARPRGSACASMTSHTLALPSFSTLSSPQRSSSAPSTPAMTWLYTRETAPTKYVYHWISIYSG